MHELVASGAVVDLLLALVVLEVAALALWRRRTGGGIAVRALLANAGAGVCLMLALRAALAAAAWPWIAGWLGLSLVFHRADLRSRWEPARGR